MQPIHIALALFLLIAPVAVLPADIAALNQQGVEAYQLKEYQKSIKCFNDALKLAPGDQRIKENLAAAYRSLSADYHNRGDSENAVKTLREGSALLPQNSLLRNDLIVVLVNRGAAFYNSKDYPRARQAVGEALQLDNNNPAANCLAGDIASAQHDLNTAREHWQRAFKADPSNKDIANRIKQLQKEQGAERTYSKMEAYHFDIRFDYQALGNGVCDLREYLMLAYEKVGQDFERFPDYPIVVILYGENEFRMVNNVPEWVAGLYDGKIRIPVNFTRYPLTTLKGILFHEYTHALIYDLAGPSCPLWLNEGIAMREMNSQLPVPGDALRRALSSGMTLPPERLDDASGVWHNAALVPLAYAQSWIMAEYLFSRWSNSQIKKMLLRFRQGASFATILREDMNRTPAQFDEEWKVYARQRGF